MSSRLKASLVTDALTMALFGRKFPTKVIVHSDQGSQYCNDKYQKKLNIDGLLGSMSATGCCYDNAAMETFFHTLKVEVVHGGNYYSKHEARSSISYYIKAYYNRKRCHSAINYNEPLSYESLVVAV